jgi:hypothetical protein
VAGDLVKKVVVVLSLPFFAFRMNVPRASCQNGLRRIPTASYATLFGTVVRRSLRESVERSRLNLQKPLILMISHAGMSCHIDVQLALHGYQTLIDRKFEFHCITRILPLADQRINPLPPSIANRSYRP